jgi:hypothetical protein
MQTVYNKIVMKLKSLEEGDEKLWLSSIFTYFGSVADQLKDL